jgi:hypothetical protein
MCYDLALASMIYAITGVEKASSSYDECFVEVTWRLLATLK